MGISSTSTALEHHPGFVRLRINPPDHGAGVCTDTLLTLIEALAPDHHLNLPLVLEGNGPCFSVGYDPAELRRFDSTAAVAYSHLGHQVVQGLEHWPGVTIALIRGPCLGPGLELALGCDLIVAGPGARFGLPGLAFGLVPCMGGLRRLGSRCGPEIVRSMFLAGRILNTREARRAGLADRSVAAPTDARTIARRWGRWAPSAVQAIRSIRLHGIGRVAATTEADLFAQGFVNGECQRRMGLL